MDKTTYLYKYFAATFTVAVIGSLAVLVSLLPEDKTTDSTYNPKHSSALSSMLSPSLNRSPASSGEPSYGVSMLVPEGQSMYLDKSITVDSLTIRGEVHCDANMADEVIEIKAKFIEIYGTFQCGTSSNPYKKKLIISLVDSNIDPKVDHKYRGMIVYNGGKLNLNGDRRNIGWSKLAQTAMPGDNYIMVERNLKIIEPNPIQTRFMNKLSKTNLETVNGRRPAPIFNTTQWKVGDKIVLGPTGYNYEEAESFTITSVSGYKLFLDNPIQYMHWGQKQNIPNTVLGNITLDERAEVANLTRNIIVRADESTGPVDEGSGPLAQRGGHIMVHHGGEGYLNSVELYKMGQAGVMARYPFHWHYVGDAPGQYVKNSSIHHSYQRCITVHRTNKVMLNNNVCYNFKGHGYFLEDGTEIENKIIKNLAIMAKAPHESKVLLQSDRISNSEGQGRFPSVSGIWISHPNNYVVNNVVSGSIGTGIWMSFETEVKDSNGNVVATPLTANTDKFNYNFAHSAKVGITWDGAPGWQNANNPNNPNDKFLTSAHYAPTVTPTFIGNRAWKNYLTGIYFRGDTAIYKNSVVADNARGFWLAYNQIMRNTVFIGKTNNTSASYQNYYYTKTRTDHYRPTGIVLYDGPFEIHNASFIDYSTSPETYTKSNGQTVNSTVVPFIATGGSNKFINITSGLNFFPEPIYRMHLQDTNEDYKERQFLGNSTIRDLDGSLSGSGVESVVTGIRSLGARVQDNCSDGGTSLYNFQVCPASYTEGSITFMRWGANAWGTPFVVMREDGATNYLINEWNQISGIANNLFATANDKNVMYKLMPKYQYEYDRVTNANPRMDANTESMHPQIPIVQLVSYGNNCRLGLDAIEASSVSDLLNQTTTSYYSNGEEFYVRVIPTDPWAFITGGPLSQATALSTLSSVGRYPITCDSGYLPKRVVGKIETVSYSDTHTTVSGWACNYTHSSSINVKLYAYGPAIGVPNNNSYSNRRVLVPQTYTYLDSTYSNQASTEEIGFHCGYLSGSGRKFTFTIPNEELEDYTNHKFAVNGISNSGGDDIYIENSNKYYVKKRSKRLPAFLQNVQQEKSYRRR